MLLSQVLLFIVSSIGLTHIIVDSTLFKPIRDRARNVLNDYWYTVFECYQCMGFWVGLFVGTLLFWPSLATVLCCGFASSFLSMFAAHYLNYLEAQTLVDLGGQDENYVNDDVMGEFDGD